MAVEEAGPPLALPADVRSVVDRAFREESGARSRR